MKVDITNPYLDLNEMVKFYQRIGNSKEMDIIAHPSDNEETNVLFVTHDYTFGIWVTSSRITIQELGFNLIPKQIFDINQIEKIDYDFDYIEIFFKRKYTTKRIAINLKDITLSSVK